jgi:hypothetical protein
MSMGLSPSPAAPPMVPRIPDIDFIRGMMFKIIGVTNMGKIFLCSTVDRSLNLLAINHS